MNTTAAPAAVRVPGLDELVEMLRRAGLPVGASEAIDAARLVGLLVDRIEPVAQERAALKTLLRPVLCKRRADLPAFDAVFDAWAQLPPLAARGSAAAASPGDGRAGPGAGDAAGGAAAATTKDADAGDGGAAALPSRRRRRWLLLAVLALLVAAATAYILRMQGGGEAAPTPEISVPGPIASAPAPAAAASGPELPTVGYFPRLRSNVELRPAWLLLLVLLAALGAAPLLLAARELPRVSRGRGRARLRLEPWPPGKALAQLVPGLPAPTEGLLQRHVRGSATEVRAFARRPQLDLRRTVGATLERGLPTPRFRFARLRPAFLVLAEAGSDDDVRLLWTQRLFALDARVELFRIEPAAAPGGDRYAEAPLCVEVGGRGRRLRLDALPNPPPGQRLIVSAPLALLFERGATRRPYIVAARLERWRERALFTHDEFGLWQAEQVQALETPRPGDPGMFVFPLDDNALEAWGQWLLRGRLPAITLSEPQQYPSALSEAEDDFCDDADLAARSGSDARAAERLRGLLAELHEYLGSNGLYWLAACAVPPLLERRLALLLGEEYFRRTGASDAAVRHYMALNWARLTRLPWFREPARQLPPWLRLALLERLPRKVQDELRALVVAALDRKARAGEASGADDDPHAVPLGFEGSAAPERGDDRGTRDLLYVGFVRQGLDAESLALRLPGQWRSWLPRALGPQRLGQRLAALGARLLRRGGVRHSGPGPGAMVVGTVSLVAAIALGAALARVDPDLLPATLRAAVFEERLRQVQTHGEERVDSFAISPSGRWLVAGPSAWRSSGGVTLWDLRDGRAVGTFETGRMVEHFAWSPDDRRLAVQFVYGSESSSEPEVVVFDMTAWPPTPGMRLNITKEKMAFSGDGGRLVTLSDDLMQWDSATGALLSPATLPQVGGVSKRRTALSADGQAVALAAEAGQLRLLDASGAALWPGEIELGITVRALAVHGGTRRVAAAAPDGRIIVLGPRPEDRLTLPPAREATPDVGVSLLAFSADGRRLFVRAGWMPVRVFDPATLAPLGPPFEVGSGFAESVGFSGTGHHLAISPGYGQVAVWSAVAAVAEADRLDDAGHGMQRAQPSPDGDRLLTLPSRPDVPGRLWQRSVDGWLPGGEIAAAGPQELSVGGTQIVRVRADTVTRFDPDSNTTTSVPNPLAGLTPVAAALVDAGPTLVIVARASGGLRVARLDLRDGTAPPPLEVTDSGDAARVFLADDGDWLAIWSGAGGLRVVDPRTGRQRDQRALSEAPTQVLWHGPRAAVVIGNRITLPRFAGDDEPRVFDHGAAAVVHAAFSPDGLRLASVGNDGAVRVWNTADGQLIGAPLLSRQPLRHVAWLPDGQRLAVSADATAAVAPVAQSAQVPSKQSANVVSAPTAAGGTAEALRINLDSLWPVAAPGVYLVHAPPLALDPVQRGLTWTRENVVVGAGVGGVASILIVLVPLMGWAMWRARRRHRQLWPGLGEAARP